MRQRMIYADAADLEDAVTVPREIGVGQAGINPSASPWFAAVDGQLRAVQAKVRG